MFELLALTALIYLFLNRKKKAHKPRTLDAELKHLIQESNDATAIGSDIKRFLLDVLNDNANDQEKFSDARIAQAQRILDRDIWQCPVVLLADVRSVGVQGDGRTYGHPIVLRPVSSEDAMTADWSRVPYEVLEKISTRITNEVREVNRVVLDVTSKPPGTIEWE